MDKKLCKRRINKNDGKNNHNQPFCLRKCSKIKDFWHVKNQLGFKQTLRGKRGIEQSSIQTKGE